MLAVRRPFMAVFYFCTTDDVRLIRAQRRRDGFFFFVYYDFYFFTPSTLTLVVASRWRAKKVIRYVRRHCLEFHRAKIQTAWQRDLHHSGWAVERRTRAPELRQPA